MLHVDDRPTLDEMMQAAAQDVDEHVAPIEDEEEYLLRLGRDSDYAPRLLFAPWPEVLERAEASPAAEWKVGNLKKRPAEPEGDYPEW